MKRRLKKNELAVIKLNQEEIGDLIKEEIFSNYNEYADILNKDVVSTICYVTEADGSISLIAAFQPIDLKRRKQDLVDEDSLKAFNGSRILGRQSIICSAEEFEEHTSL